MTWDADKQRQYMREYYSRNREKVLAANAVWRAKNKERHLAGAREYHRKNSAVINARKAVQRILEPEEIRRRYLWRKWKLTPAQFDNLAVLGCEICHSKDSLVVDHCHTSGVVRGVLCSPCNTAIGLMKEDPERLQAAIEYVKQAAMMKAEAAAAEQQG